MKQQAPREGGLSRRLYVIALSIFALTIWVLFFRQSLTTSVRTHSVSAATANPGAPFPLIRHKIWQTAAAGDQHTIDILQNSWHKLNPYWRYELLSDEGAETFVNESFYSTRPDIIDTYHRIETPILKVDLLRYLVLLHDGGLYADVDVECMKSIDTWLPKELQDRAGMIVGIEYDDNVHEDMPSISIAQYAFMARQGHPILEAVVEAALVKLKQLGDRASSGGHARPGVISAKYPNDVLEATGPYMFSRVLFETLKQMSDFKSPDQLHLLRKPVMFGDVVILPINGFGWGQDHSRSGELDMGEVLVEHHFRRSWRNPVTWELASSGQKHGDG